MSEDRQERFTAYVEALAEVIGHADRAEPLRDYCLGLLLPGERKSLEPIAAVTAPARVSAQHQSLLHFVANAPWSDERVLSRIQELTVPIIEHSGAIEAWIIDDTGFPKKARHWPWCTKRGRWLRRSLGREYRVSFPHCLDDRCPTRPMSP